MKKILKNTLNGEVFFILFLFSGYYKIEFMNIFIVDPTILFFGLSVLSALKRLYKRKAIYKVAIAPIAIYAIIIIMMVISMFFVLGNPYSTSKTFNFIVITGWSFVAPFILVSPSSPTKSLNRFVGTILFIGLLMTFNSFASDSGDKFSTAFGSNNYLSLGKASALAALILITYLLTNKTKKKTIFVILLLTGCSVYAMLSSGGRMPVLSFAICLTILLLTGIKIKRIKFGDITFKKRTLFVGTFLLLSSPLLIKYLVDNNSTVIHRFTQLLSDGGGASAGARMNHYDKVAEVMSSNVMGVGIGGYSVVTGVPEAYPHNIFLEFMVELGLIGLIVFTVLLLISIVRYFKNFFSTNNFHSMVILMFFLYSFLNANTSGDLNDNRLLFFSISLLCLSRIFNQSINRNT